MAAISGVIAEAVPGVGIVTVVDLRKRSPEAWNWMCAITLHQPLASLITLRLKTVETRSWPAPARLVGQRIAVHAGKRMVKGTGGAIEQEVHPSGTGLDPAYPDWHGLRLIPSLEEVVGVAETHSMADARGGVVKGLVQENPADPGWASPAGRTCACPETPLDDPRLPPGQPGPIVAAYLRVAVEPGASPFGEFVIVGPDPEELDPASPAQLVAITHPSAIPSVMDSAVRYRDVMDIGADRVGQRLLVLREKRP